MKQHKQPLILAVDDERANLMLLERILRAEYEVTCVSNGRAALDILPQAAFDLVLLDIMMPELDGISALKEIRANPQISDIPVILISALAEAHDISRGLEAGANDYITKPIDMDVTKARVHTQITLKRLQDERKQTITELKAAQEMKDRLLWMASHDLKGPVNNIRAAASLLEDGVENISNGIFLLETIELSADRMENVIKDFLDTAALQTGVLDLKLEILDVEPLVKDVITELHATAVRKEIAIETGDLPGKIIADSARFHQALGNLISNAVKYSPPNTTITIWSEANTAAVTIHVSDQGPGIPPDEHDRLFTQFGKLTPRPTAGESSTGLGLWIVKHLTTLQNGEVGLISPPERGSIFWIKLPAAVEEEAEIEA